MSEAIALLRNYPQIVIFAAVACGYFIGKIKIFGFNLGSTAGVLLVALVFGQLEISIPPLLEAIMFAFFIFCIGYKVGPEFFSGNVPFHWSTLKLRSPKTCRPKI